MSIYQLDIYVKLIYCVLMNFITKNLLSLRVKIKACEQKFHRRPDSISLLAVSKSQSIEKIQEAIASGQKSFGENYLQEALPKIEALKDQQMEWHFIGSIQRNKTRKIAEHFDWVQSVTDQQMAKRLNDQRPEHLPPLNICLEINISHEQTKSGIDEEEAFALAAFCETLPRLKLRGLMAIPAPKPTFDEQRIEMRKLTALFTKMIEKGFKLDTLSMGMSQDWEAAIAEGATMIRLGTAIFGVRN